MHQTASFHKKRICQHLLDTKLHINTRHVFFAHLPFQTHDPTQPTKNKKFRPIPNPTQPNPRVNPTHGQLWVQLPITPENLCHAATTTAAVVVLAVEQNRHLSLKERRKERLKSQCPATAPYPNSYTYGRHGLALQRPMEYSH